MQNFIAETPRLGQELNLTGGGGGGHDLVQGLEAPEADLWNLAVEEKTAC